MAAVRYRFRAELPARWQSVLALALLAGLAGGITLAAIAGARRTDSAFSRMLAATDAAHVLVNPDFGNDSGLDWGAVDRLPMVEAAGVGRGILVWPLPLKDAEALDEGFAFGLTGDAGVTVGRPLVYDGRVPDRRRANEVLVNPRFVEQHGIGVDEQFEALVLGQDDLGEIEASGVSIVDAVAGMNDGTYGTKVALRIAGVGEVPESIVVDEGFEDSELYASPAFLRRYPQADAGWGGALVRLRRGAADIPAFKEAVQALPHEGAIEFQTTTVTEAKVARAVRPQVGALAVFALVIALTGLLLVGQALARQTFLESVDHPTLRALGFGRRQLVAVALLRAVVIGLGAAAIAVAVAIAASPVTPIGVARDADPDLGLFVDSAIVVPGALAVFVLVVVLAAIPAWWHTRAARFRTDDQSPARSSRLVGWLRGAPPVAAAGVRMALEPGRGRTAVPVRTTILGVALAIATVVAALTFASSLDHLVSTPRLYGVSWDARVETGGETEADAKAVHRRTREVMSHEPSVRAFSDASISRVELDGVTVTAVAVEPVKGALGLTTVDGRAPRADGEVALGAKTMDRIGVEVGDTVRGRPDAGGSTRPLRVVGQVVLPGLGTYSGSDKTALGEGAVLAPAELRRLGPDFGTGAFLVQLRPRASETELARAVADTDDPTRVAVAGLERPSDIVSYERVRTTPLALAGVLAVLAMATMGHALVTAVRRRRRDLALLKTLGFTRRQVSASVAWQATTLGAASLLIGVPVGVILGRWAWTALAKNLGTVADPVVPLLAVVLAIPLVLFIANVVAFVPGRLAARLRPAAVLRSE